MRSPSATRASAPPTPAPSRPSACASRGCRRPIAARRATCSRPATRGAHRRPPPRDAGRAQLLAARAALLHRVEATIARDARARARRGEISGPIRGSQCGPYLRAPDAVPDDRVLSKTIGRYDCVAVRDSIKGAAGTSVGSVGYPFVAALDFRRFTYVWCRNTPPPSERGEALAFVRLDRTCLASKGRALGTGYVDVPGS